jgi:hypothetical protein
VRSVTAKIADYPLTGADTGGFFTNTGATGAVIFTLPAVATSTGWWYDIMVTAAQTVTITAPANKLVTFNNAAATSIAFDQVGKKVGMGVRVTCDGAKWIVAIFPGTLTTAYTIS